MDNTVIVAIIALIGSLTASAVAVVTNRLTRKDAKEDKRQERHDEVMAAIKSLGDKVSSVEYRLDETATVQCRVRILRFADEVVHGDHHSKDHFEQTLEDIHQYEMFCDKHPAFRNEITSASVKLIKDTYRERLKANDFL